MDFKHWSDSELFGKSACHVISIHKLEDDGLLVYGNFQTFMRFKQDGDRLTRLDVGQTTY